MPVLTGSSFDIPGFTKGQSCLRVSGLPVTSSQNVLFLNIHVIVLSSFRPLLIFSTLPLLCFNYLPYIYLHLTYVFIIYLPPLKCKLQKLNLVCINESLTTRIIPVNIIIFTVGFLLMVGYICQYKAKTMQSNSANSAKQVG